MTSLPTELKEANQLLNAATEGMLRRLEKFSAIKLRQDESSWNPSEVIQHLTISEKGILGYIRKKTLSGWLSLEEANEDTEARGKILLERLASAEKYPAPEFIAKPQKDILLKDAVREWLQHREELTAYFETAPNESLNLLVFRQPAAGMLTLIQTVHFIAAHIRHHYCQIDSYTA
jgi:hypothetical protein